jgi:hypothetical protein
MEHQSTYMKTQMLPDYLLVVEPTNFKVNTESQNDNPHMKAISLSDEEIQTKVLQEHKNYQNALTKYGAKFKVVPQVHPDAYDSIYACDWCATLKNEDFPTGVLFVFPMHGKARSLEKNWALVEELKKNFEHFEDLSFFEEKGLALESFGTMPIDFHNRTVYVNLSERAALEPIKYFMERLNALKVCKEEYTVRFIDSLDPVSGDVCFHTGLYLSFTDTTVFFCRDFVRTIEEAQKIYEELSKDKPFKYDVIEITTEECVNMCANLVEVKISSEYGKTGLVMSTQAYNTFSQDNLKRLKEKYEVITAEVDTIHHCGGGSVRCMANIIY